MLNFETTLKKESLLFPGVTFTVRVLNSIERARRDAPILNARAKLTELSRAQEAAELAEKGGLASLRASAEISNIVESQVIPAYIRAGFISIEGVQINGAAPTVETLLSGGRTSLLAEIYVACQEASELDAETAKNSPSSSTLAEGADGRQTITTAPSANGIASIVGVTAERLTMA